MKRSRFHFILIFFFWTNLQINNTDEIRFISFHKQEVKLWIFQLPAKTMYGTHKKKTKHKNTHLNRECHFQKIIIISHICVCLFFSSLRVTCTVFLKRAEGRDIRQGNAHKRERVPMMEPLSSWWKRALNTSWTSEPRWARAHMASWKTANLRTWWVPF